MSQPSRENTGLRTNIFRLLYEKICFAFGSKIPVDSDKGLLSYASFCDYPFKGPGTDFIAMATNFF